ncbi:alpha/beta fold hydrolase [Streptomyces sp. NPDC048581]|uniref:alpha/beta fold hydrolase n=1 Tax=unclassified Streptomyces TaxID=2593676 RepID=UPI003718E23D
MHRLPRGGVRLWTEDRGAADAHPLLLIMGAQASGLGWPDELVDMLASRHRVIRYDHRDTGRSTWAFDQRPYPLGELAEDALAVLDALDVQRAHIVGMSMGGMLAQLLIADHPDRLLSATLLGTSALSTIPYIQPDETRTPPEELPGIAPRLLEMWSRPVVDLGLEADPYHLAQAIQGARIVGIPGMGHALPPEVHAPLAAAVLDHTTRR